MRLTYSKACGVRDKAVKQMLNKRMNTAKQGALHGWLIDFT